MKVLPAIGVLVACCGLMAADLLPAEQGGLGHDQARRALRAVDRWLEKSQHAQAWHRRLETNVLRRELAKEGPPDLAVVERWLERLTADTPVAAHAPLVALRRCVEGWLAAESLRDGQHLPAVTSSILRSEGNWTLARQGPSRAELRKHLVALAAMLSRYAKEPDDDLAQAIDEELAWLDAAGQAAALVDAVRHYYGHPNVWIDIAEDVLADPVVRTIDRSEPVSDVILGTPLSGDGRVRAESDLLIEADSDRAVLKIVVHGQVEAQTIGRRGPARIHSRSTTTFRAEKRLIVEQTGLRVLPTVCSARLNETGSGVSSIRGGLRGLLIRRIAQRRWQASQNTADEEAARHVEAQVAAVVDREADELIGRLDRFVIGPVVALANGGSSKSRIRFSSEEGVLRIGVRRGRLGAPPGIPPVDAGRLFTVRVHSSLVNRVAALALVDVPSLSGLSFLTPSKALERVSLLGQPGGLFRASLAADSSPMASLVGNQFWQRLAWRLIERTVAPRVDAGGIVLRDGRWGRLTSAELGGEWPLLGWQPVADLLTDPALPSAELSARLKALR